MSTEVRSFSVTVPAGTPQYAPLTVDIGFPPRIVTEIDIVTPPGPSGNVGFAVTVDSVPVIPVNPGEWIVSDDETIHWPVIGGIDSGAWQMTAYNTGVFDHAIQVRFLLTVIDTTPPAGVPAYIPAQQLTPPADDGANLDQLLAQLTGPSAPADIAAGM